MPACVDQWKSRESGPVHRVMIVISDGKDTGSRHVPERRHRRRTAQRNPDLYAQSPPEEAELHGRRDIAEAGGRDRRKLLHCQQCARGGRHLQPNSSRSCARQYYVSFRPQDELPGYHALQVEVAEPQEADGACAAWILRAESVDNEVSVVSSRRGGFVACRLRLGLANYSACHQEAASAEGSVSLPAGIYCILTIVPLRAESRSLASLVVTRLVISC